MANLGSLKSGQTVAGPAATKLSAVGINTVTGVMIQPLSTNTGSVFVGGSDLTSLNGYELIKTAGPIRIPVTNADEIYILSSGTQVVTWLIV